MVSDEQAKLATARLGAPHGVRGFQAVRTYSGDTEHLFRLGEVELRELRSGRLRTATVDAVRQLGDKVVMRLSGVTTPEQARALSGWELWVPRSEASTLAEGEYYTADLCGCSVFHGGRAVGTVTSVLVAGGGDMLEVTDGAGKPFMVPFRELFVPALDIAARRIELAEEFERP
jgi:16S rRNA processing protein RimM